MNSADFAQGIQADLSHRKQELSRVWLMVQESDPDPHRLSCLSRSAIVLAYAHWEGFVKSGSKRYIKYINAQQFPVDRLKGPLQAAHLTSQFKRGASSAKTRFLGELLKEIDRVRSSITSINADKCIDTESNLSSTVFRDLVLGIGLDYFDSYSLRQNFIDEQVVRSRNQVAHGELVTFGSVEVDDRIKGVVRLIETYGDQLMDAVQQNAFLDNP